MAAVTCQEEPPQTWETISEGITRTLMRAEPREKRVLIRIEAGRTSPHHIPNEIFVIAGTYCEPGVENSREFPAGSYLYYPPGTAQCAGSPSGSEGCTILFWNAGN